MTPVMLFGDVLEAADHLSLEEQQELIAVLQRRVAEAGRRRVVAEVQEARLEFAAGLGRPSLAAELIARFWDVTTPTRYIILARRPSPPVPESLFPQTAARPPSTPWPSGPGRIGSPPPYSTPHSRRVTKWKSPHVGVVGREEDADVRRQPRDITVHSQIFQQRIQRGGKEAGMFGLQDEVIVLFGPQQLRDRLAATPSFRQCSTWALKSERQRPKLSLT